ncbi:MAG: DUF5676 family membrane protein [Nitrospirota bacterium]
MLIRPLAFANALALTTALLGILLIVLRLFAPAMFVLIFNAQFFGADVAMLLPVELHVIRVIIEFLALVGGAWSFGLVGAVLYNWFIK